MSTALLAITLVLCFASIWLNPWDHSLSLGRSFHVGVWGRGGDIRLVFFNDADYGPYRGSIVTLGGGEDESGSEFDREFALGDTAGVYYRSFRWPNGSAIWTLMVSLWYLVGLFAVLPVWRLWKRRCGCDSSNQAPAVTECSPSDDRGIH